jgi:hypothetical protein
LINLYENSGFLDEQTFSFALASPELILVSDCSVLQIAAAWKGRQLALSSFKTIVLSLTKSVQVVTIGAAIAGAEKIGVRKVAKKAREVAAAILLMMIPL